MSNPRGSAHTYPQPSSQWRLWEVMISLSFPLTWQTLFPHPDTLCRFGDLVIDDKAHDVIISDQKINLTPKEYDLLKYFVNNNNVALSREQLLTNVWGYDFYGDDRTIDTHVKTLRKNLGKYGDYIKTVRGVGYKFEYQENK